MFLFGFYLFFSTMISNTQLNNIYSSDTWQIQTALVLSAILVVCQIILFIWNLKYQSYTRILIFILISCMYIVSIFLKTPMFNIGFYLMFLFIFNSKFINYYYFANVTSLILSVTFVFILIMFFAGFFPKQNNVILISQNGSFRYSLGFMHPNTLGVFAFSLCSFLILSADKSNYKLRYIVSLFIFIIISYVSQSRGLEISGIILILLLIIGKIKFFKHFILKLSYLFPLICAYIAIYMPFNYNGGNATYFLLNKYLSDRLYLQNYILKLYNIKIFGQQTPLIGSTTGLWLDNAYLTIILINGILTLCIFMILFIYSCIRLVRLNNYVLCCVIIALLFGEMIEFQLNNAFVYAIFILAFTYNKKMIGEIK